MPATCLGAIHAEAPWVAQSAEERVEPLSGPSWVESTVQKRALQSVPLPVGRRGLSSEA